MCSMCHYCGSEPSQSKEEKSKRENGNHLRLNGGGPISSCKICGEKQHNSSLYSTPRISPATSLSSSDRSFSSCSELSVDGSYDQVDQEEGTTSGNHKDISFKMNGQSRNVLEANGLDRLNLTMVQNCKNNNNGSCDDVERELRIEQPSDGQERKVNGVESTGVTHKDASESSDSVDLENNLDIWDPPVDCIADNDDDDDEECGGDTKFSRASSLSDAGEEGSGRLKFQEEKKRAMDEVTSGKFKSIVRQLLKSVGVTPYQKDGESWVDIITKLSWEAALFLEPSAIDGKALDLDSYVKVKCIATGSRSQSQLVKGLVFKKHAAHKHMPTNYKNASLLLIREVLGQSSSGLSSFNAMEQEKGYLRSVMDMIETCHPNVILVEKTVSRDIQEAILAKGMTLVLDMKLHRLERIARCTGSPILSSDKLTSQKLKRCESFYIEKFIEEHAALTDGGKRPSKTLMFIEGCPTHLGCTVLLKGSDTDELKRIKYVVQCAVVMAYHLILETSFLLDQRAMFSTITCPTGPDAVPAYHQGLASENGNFTAPCSECTAKTEPDSVDIPVSNGYHEDSSYASTGFEGDSMLSYEPYNPAIFAGLSTLSSSLKKVIGDSFSLPPAASYPSLSSLFGLHGKVLNGQTAEEVPVSKIMEVTDDMDGKSSSDEEKPLDGKEQTLSASSEIPLLKDCGNDEEELQSKEDANSALDSQSILVLMSSRNALRGTICEQSHFSHIMFYKNFDIPLGKFLQDNLLNQKRHCVTCGELPEAHFYYYAHHKKQLTIQVKRLPEEKCLSPGKLWMWSRCGKCKIGNEVSKSTKRVLISPASCGLSFGKFLELSFSHHSSFGRLSSCGHSPHRDFLYFFGLGPMVAMFRYSSVTIYNISVPPQKLKFSNSIDKEWLDKEVWREGGLCDKGMELFTKVKSFLEQRESQFRGCTLNLRGVVKDFSVVLEMLEQERAAFKVNIHNAITKDGNPDEAFHKLLRLNRLRWEILLASCIWGRRLHSLVSRDPTVVITGELEEELQKQCKSMMNGTTVRVNEESEINNGNGDKLCNNGDHPKVKLESAEANGLLDDEIPVDGPVAESELPKDQYNNTSTVAENKEVPSGSASHCSGSNGLQLKNLHVSENLKIGDIEVPNSPDEAKSDTTTGYNFSEESVPPSCSLVSNLETLRGWYWMSFSGLSQIYMKDLQRGFEPKLESLIRNTSEHLPDVYQKICEEYSRSHIPIGNDNYIVSDFEGELSSIIACALASSLKETPGDEGSSHSLTRTSNLASPNWSFNSTLESDSIQSTLSIGSEDSRLSSFDGLNLLESLLPPEMQGLDVLKTFGKGRYSVKCLYPTEFRDLRSRCCPSELDYIDSLSRCRNWDAKGGKSKSFFAKTIDNRFIIKEIKKTEFDSFVKFAGDYFKYMNQSYDIGNQTCLAKVLGIYQVTVKNTKSGKEMRHVLMVMENLTFGRNIIRQYDLKGALHARFNAVVDGSGDVLLDQNFVNDMNTSPLYVSNKAKRLLERAVWNDTSFLNLIDVMDYSLLVGVDADRQELVCGIIDYLRQYTWDKHLETWVKSSLVPKNVLPTVISPKEYKKRFRGFMSRHFLCVPDAWCSDEPSDPCNLCGANNDDGSSSSSSG